MKIGATEIILLLLLALIIFGGRKLSGIGKAVGTSIRDFKREIKADDKVAETPEADEISTTTNEVTTKPTTTEEGSIDA